MTEELLNNFALRPDLKKIYSLIQPNWNVLDLGCGGGQLLKELKDDLGVKGLGVENDQERIMECVEKGVPVIQGNLNDPLMFRRSRFDAVILSQTLQAVERPDKLLDEMLRVGDRAIISFINFSYFKNRLQLFFTGRMPVSKTISYQWYNTPNIHFATIKDFRKLCKDKGYTIISESPMGEQTHVLASLLPNFFAAVCVFEVTGKQ